MRLHVPLVVCLATFALPGQERFQAGELKGFTKSPTEHILERLDAGVVVRRLEGRVGSKEQDKPLEGVLVEIRGPGQADKFRSALSDQNGRFRIGGVRDGDYTIKLTLNGFRSVTGTISVRGSYKESRPFRVEMLLGV